jgi:protein-tyrosine phosphatase
MRVIFVCLGNICRSPTAEAILRDLARAAGRTDLEIASAGTGRWHVGEPPDPRAIATARDRGVAMDHLGRHFTRADFAAFDLIVPVDAAVRRAVLALAPDDAAAAKVKLLRAFDPAAPPEAELPDPYYGDRADFEVVYDLCVAACRGLLATLPP